MKKTVLLITIFLLSASLVSAQITIKPHFGIALGSGSDVANEGGSDVEENSTGLKTKRANLYYSAGAGIDLGLSIGMDIAENLGLALGFGVLAGSEQTTAKLSSAQAIGETFRPFGMSINNVKTGEQKATTSYLPLSLTMKVQTKLGKLTPYAGFGPTLALGPKMTGTFSAVDTTAIKTEGEMELTYNTGFGVHGVLGADYAISDMLSIGLELKAQQLTLKGNKFEFTKYTVNGVDGLAGATTSQKETELVEDNPDSLVPAPATSPSIMNTIVTPANNITIALGLSIKL